MVAADGATLPHQGGSHHVACALCPVRCGAFRRTVDGMDWVHQVRLVA